jgi:hypothetical protein
MCAPAEHCSITTMQVGTSAATTFQHVGNIPLLRTTFMEKQLEHVTVFRVQTQLTEFCQEYVFCLHCFRC